MKRIQKNIPLFLLLILMSALLSACSIGSGKATRFYAITPLATQALSQRPQLRLGVGPVQIPRLLRRPQIVIRKSQTEVDLIEAHQWGGSLREDLLNAFESNLAVLLGTESVEIYPWKHSFKPNYQVRINIEQLDGDLGKTVTLKARWRLLQGKKVVMVKRPVIQVPIKGGDYNAYVKAQSEAIYRLSKLIAGNI